MTAKPPGATTVQEYSIRVPKVVKKKHNVMRFNGNLDFTQWKQVKMERENNMKEFKGFDEDQPKYGAGSEFGRDAREEARRKKFGITSKKYKPENQPWILKAGGRTGKKFKGIREGGVSANASYYVFTHAPDGAIEAFPLHEWYKFQPIQRYKALSAEEAEAEFSRRNKTMNYHAIMVRKRLKNDEEGNDEDAELAEGGKKSKASKKEKELKISEMDEWMDSDDDSDDSEEEKEKKVSDDESDGGKKKKKKGKAPPKKKKNKKASDDEAFEESDDGDEEGRECDYISDSTDSELEMDGKEIKSVAEEDALRKLLASDEEDEDEQKDKTEQGDESENDENKDKEDKDKAKDGQKSKEKKKKNKKNNNSNKKKDGAKKNGKDSSSDFSSDSGSDSDAKDKDKDKDKDKNKMNSAHSSRSATPVPGGSNVDNLKRKLTASPDISQAKKFKLDNFNSAPATAHIPGLAESGITEEAVRRYLMRKPMTTTELLQKFKSKKTGLKSDDLVNIMTLILKKINPTKQTVKNKMYLSLKPQPQ